MTTCISEYRREGWGSSSTMADATSLIEMPPSGSYGVTSSVPAFSLLDLRAYVDIRDSVAMLGRVNYVFSLNYKKLSEAMCVTRPTVYSWLDGETVPDVSKSRRLYFLYSLANYWWSVVGMKMEKEIRKVRVGNSAKCVDELLVEESLDLGDFVAALDELGGIAPLDRHPKPSLAERLRKKGRKPKSAAAVDRDLR